MKQKVKKTSGLKTARHQQVSFDKKNQIFLETIVCTPVIILTCCVIVVAVMLLDTLGNIPAKTLKKAYKHLVRYF